MPDHRIQQDMLFGRERELAELDASLKNARAGNGELVLISGEAGIGKTSLVRAVCENAVDDQFLVHISSCYDLGVTPPYRPWIDVFAELGHQISPPSDVADNRPSDWATSQDALFSEALDALHDATRRQPRLMVLEDMHWADSASLEFLRYAARQVQGLAALIFVTYRDTEIDRDHPFHAHLPGLIRESDAIRISLRALDETSIDSMLQQRYRFSPPDQSRLRDYLQIRTEGNPFFIEEMLRSLEENGAIVRRDDQWTLGDLRQTPVPALVRQVIDSRLAQLDPESRQLLAIAAAIGQDVPIDIWQQVADAGDSELSTAIRTATQLSILDEFSRQSMLQFTHALVREALYFERSLPERRTLHRRIAEAYQEFATADPDAIAWHFQQAQDERAIDWLMIAGERAQQLYAWRTAAERFAAVLDLVGENASRARARGWLAYRIGLLLTYADATTGIHRLQDAEQLATETGDTRLRAYARADRGLLRCLTGDVRRGLTELRSGVEAIDGLNSPADDGDDADEDDSRLSVSAIRRNTFQLFSSADDINARQGPLVFWLAWAGRYEDALAIGTPFVEQASAIAGNIHDALGDGLAGLGHALAALGQPDASLNAFSRARDTFGAIDHHFKVGNTAIYELSEALLPYRADRIMEREWLADQAEAG